MYDEWMRSVTGSLLVKFTYLELSDGGAFLTAQIGGHEVVYSVILDTAKDPLAAKMLNVTLSASASASYGQFQTDPLPRHVAVDADS